MKWTRFLLPVLMIGAFAVACGDDNETTGVTTADLAGDWEAGAFSVSGNAALGPLDGVNLVNLGVDFFLDVQTNGNFTFSTAGLSVVTQGLLDDISITGTITVTGNNTAEVEASTDPGNPSEATFSLSGDNLTLSIPDAALIDFDDSGTVESDELVDIQSTMSR